MNVESWKYSVKYDNAARKKAFFRVAKTFPIFTHVLNVHRVCKKKLKHVWIFPPSLFHTTSAKMELSSLNLTRFFAQPCTESGNKLLQHFQACNPQVSLHGTTLPASLATNDHSQTRCVTWYATRRRPSRAGTACRPASSRGTASWPGNAFPATGRYSRGWKLSKSLFDCQAWLMEAAT